MKKLVVLISVLVLTLGIAGYASAQPMCIEDVIKFSSVKTYPSTALINYGYESVNMLENEWDSIDYLHKFEYNPACCSLISATLTIYLKDDGCDPEADKREFGRVWTEGHTYVKDLGEINDDEYDCDVNLDYLWDAEYEVRLRSSGGDFKICQSILAVCYEPCGVPEPATLLLLGIGLCGLSGIRRKIKS